jgi:hypothetical protein
LAAVIGSFTRVWSTVMLYDAILRASGIPFTSVIAPLLAETGAV